MYLDKFNNKLCGKLRKNHFKGVIDVVNRLLEIIKPQKILLGLKDFQQVILIKKHIKKRKIKTKIISCKTIRENNGIPCSSRNEKLFQTALGSSKIDGWIFEYQNGIYQYDFAFPKIKLDIEIDGGTHLTDKVKKIDERRDIWSKSQGWTVLRFTAKEVKTDIIKCIDKVKEFLHGL